MLGWWLAIAQAADVDGDGVDSAVDCDDTDAAVGVAPTWFLDADYDTHGRPTGGVAACVAPAVGWVTRGDDCDDARHHVSPSTYERCDPVDRDEDCDGLSDDADPSVTRRTTWYVDGDGDGYGVAPSVAVACSGPPGAVEVSGDCDDTRASVAWVQTWYPDADADGYAIAAGATASCGAPGPTWTTTLGSADCNDAAADIWPGAPDTCADGADQSCDGYDAVCPWWDTTVSGSVVGEGFGQSLAVGDVDGDGALDLTVSENGDLWLFDGPFLGDRAADSASAHWTTTTTGAVDAALGDADGDGAADVLVGDNVASFGPRNQVGGAALILDGDPRSGNVVSAASYAFAGAHHFSDNGRKVAMGDVDLDGFSDAWVASPLRSDVLSQSGLIFLQTLPAPTAIVDLGAPTTGIVYGDYPGQAIGAEGLLAADIDGDADADLVFSSRRNGGMPAALFLVRTPPVGGVAATAAGAMLTAPGLTVLLTGFSSGDLTGDGVPDVAMHANTSPLVVRVVSGTATSGSLASSSVAVLGSSIPVVRDMPGDTAIGDFDGDGQMDLAIGLPYADAGADGSGVVWLVRGPLSGAIDLAGADRVLAGVSPADGCGAALEAADLDGDGVDDLLVGCTQRILDSSATRGVGQVRVALAPLL